MTSKRDYITTEHLGPDATDADVAGYCEWATEWLADHGYAVEVVAGIGRDTLTDDERQACEDAFAAWCAASEAQQ